MPRKCSLCIHARRQEIEQALLCGDSYRIVAQRFTVSRDAVVRHRRHLPAALVRAEELKEIAHGESLVAHLRDLIAEAQRLKVVAEKAGDYRAALAAVRELCRIVELIAKLSGELESHSETKILNVTLDAETARRISDTFLARHQLARDGS
jgi:HrpA-like RNA helicase